jgi:hypothetical protein
MCGVEESGNKGKRTSVLCGVAPLRSGAPFEIVEGREIWHPIWEGKIDEGVNVQFIKAAIDRIWENEQVSKYSFPSAYVLIFLSEDPKRPEWEG